MGRIAGRFARVEPRRRAGQLVLGLLADLPRKNCRTIAEWAGDTNPHGMQHLLCRVAWDADAVRDDVREYVVEHLHDEAAVRASAGRYFSRGLVREGPGSGTAPRLGRGHRVGERPCRVLLRRPPDAQQPSVAHGSARPCRAVHRTHGARALGRPRASETRQGASRSGGWRRFCAAAPRTVTPTPTPTPIPVRMPSCRVFRTVIARGQRPPLGGPVVAIRLPFTGSADPDRPAPRNRGIRPCPTSSGDDRTRQGLVDRTLTGSRRARRRGAGRPVRVPRPGGSGPPRDHRPERSVRPAGRSRGCAGSRGRR